MLARAGAMGRRWTADEDRKLRELYPRGVSVVRRALDGARSDYAIMQRAFRLGVHRKPHWAAADDRQLTFLWESRIRLSAIARRMGRTPFAVYRRAQTIGLSVGAPDGFEYITGAARRCGFAIRTMATMLRAAGVQFHITHSDPGVAGKGTWRRHYVDPDDVDRAVSAWMAAETVKGAAEARNINRMTLHRWLIAAGLTPPGHKRTWRLPVEVIDRVVAKHRSKENA